MSKEAAASLIHRLTSSPFPPDTLDTIVSTAEGMVSTDAEHLAFVTIRLLYAQEEPLAPHRAELAGESARYLLHDLRTLVRKTDRVYLVGHTLYFLLPGAHTHGGRIVRDRLWEALLWGVHNLTEQNILCPQSMAIGYSSYPMRGKTIRDCLAVSGKTTLRFEAQPEKTRRAQAGEASAGPPAQDEADQELAVLARELGIPYLTRLPRTLPSGLHQLVDPRLAHELRCYPLGRERTMLTVAMESPVDHRALDRLKQETGLRIFPVLTHPHTLAAALEQLVESVHLTLL